MNVVATAALEDAPEQRVAPSAWRRRAAWCAFWLGAIVLAGYFDVPLASRVYSSGIYQTVKYSLLFQALKAPGAVWSAFVLTGLAWCLSRPSARPAVLLGTAAALAGLLCTVAKWSVGRGRPIAHGVYNLHPFRPAFFHDGLAGLFAAQNNQSFPSGHACLAFALAVALAICAPRYTFAFLVVAAMVGAERLLEGAHYLSDVLAGGGLGVVAALIAGQLYARLLGAREANGAGGA
jgi:membrane-associated phospholipid phosphatase